MFLDFCQMKAFFSIYYYYMLQISDFIFPSTSSLELIDGMQKEASYIVEEKKGLLRRGLSSIDSIHAVAMYDHAPCIRSAISQLKYYRKKSLAIDLAKLMDQHISVRSSSVLCPVPLHWTRRFSRGFNQSELLAKQLGVRRNISVCHLLKRVRPTGHQAWRGRQERLTAVQNAFCFCCSTLPKSVVLIDDLSTTGSTLESCAEVLKTAGVEKVEAWVIALA